MGVLMRDAFMWSKEHHTAWLNELEFAEIARTLKAMARDQGLETDAIINELVHFGVDAAFALLSVQAETGRIHERRMAARKMNRAGMALVN